MFTVQVSPVCVHAHRWKRYFDVAHTELQQLEWSKGTAGSRDKCVVGWVELPQIGSNGKKCGLYRKNLHFYKFYLNWDVGIPKPHIKREHFLHEISHIKQIKIIC